MYGTANGKISNINTSFGKLSTDIINTHLPKIPQGTKLYLEGNEGVAGIVSGVLSTIDSNFKITQEKFEIFSRQ